MASKIDFIVIKTKEAGVFVSDNVGNKSYFTSRIPNLYFDGKFIETTYKSNWFKLEAIPEKVEEKGASKSTNLRYELKAGFPVSELTPETISEEDWDYDSDISGLYTRKFDTEEGVLETVEFNIEVLSEEDNFFIEKPKYPITSPIMVSLTTHPALLSERSCAISGKELYTVLRKYIKLNINPQYASISSDYDFCLNVQKNISQEPVKYLQDIGKGKRSKFVERYNSKRTVDVFKTSPEGYSSYPVQHGINAKNQKELEEKVDKYLEDLITKINKPLVNCECCKGTGVILKSDDE